LVSCVTPPEPAPKPVIVVNTYPLEFIVREVAGPLAEIQVMPTPTPEAPELSAAQVTQLQSATLVFYQSGLSPAIDAVLAGADMSRVVDTATLVGELPVDTDYAQNTEGNPVPGTQMDPYTWLNPANMGLFTNVLADRLVKLLPANTTTIGQASNALVERFGELDAAFLAALTDCERREFLTSYPAFRYLASAYGLTQLSVPGLDSQSEPTAELRAQVSELVGEYGLTTLLVYPAGDETQSDNLSATLGLEVALLDPVETITAASPGSDYLQVMYTNLEVLRLANGCSWQTH
jgi:zinc transport system substrate-binding protein